MPDIGVAPPNAAKKTISSIASQGLFTIAGGPVRVISIIGHVTTAIQAAANNLKMQFTPTGGSAVDICDNLNVNGIAIRKLLAADGNKLDPMTESTDAGVFQPAEGQGNINTLILIPGTISLVASATTTGVIDWAILFEPLVPGAKIEAV